MFKKIFGILALLIACVAGRAQELNCKVTILHEKITGVDPQLFTGMQRAITEFMNAHKWTTDEYATGEKIDCNILINITSNNVNSDIESFAATISVQASRPVYNSSYTSTLINYQDKDFSFKYSQFSPLRFEDNQVVGTDPMTSNLTAVLAYYAYMMLALDYDSFSPLGGTNYLKKAQNIVNNAPEGKGITGWKSVESTRNRYWIADQMLNTRFQDIRSYWYTLHREGLDSMYTRPTEARGRILTNLRKIYQVNRENPSSALIQFFFAAKSDEIQHILAQAPKSDRGQYITMLNAMDVPNAAKYNALK